MLKAQATSTVGAHVEPSPPHTPHASSTLPCVGHGDVEHGDEHGGGHGDEHSGGHGDEHGEHGAHGEHSDKDGGVRMVMKIAMRQSWRRYYGW